MIIVPASADSELTLRRAEQKGLIKYSPGSEQFEILKDDDLNDKQKNALAVSYTHLTLPTSDLV